MSSLKPAFGRSSSSLSCSHDEKLARKNIEDLARIIASEASNSNETAQLMVGWTVINRMKRRHLKSVSTVWQHGNYAHNQSGTAMSRRIAASLLSGQAPDISQGATLFYSPISMPKEKETDLSKYDTQRGLETVDGVSKNGKPIRNYVPSWAYPARRIFTPGIPEYKFKFYKE
ncbi:cell wall hydrolase [Novacetimonas cocois]|uniref:Uncharacterized protein n=1 Tax=Novacetimonas cocois TaxID=1747507 RepID=A0A365YUQ3_9PROT|nr:cell wall hydrolase [Novacetimonas cocois]RBM06739.1 hypothetical protein NJLHNGOC_08765 [Novacetimonas cocois]